GSRRSRGSREAASSRATIQGSWPRRPRPRTRIADPPPAGPHPFTRKETHRGVLDGIKVLELARVPPAEMPGMFLADMGADVLKIETPEPEGAGGGGAVLRRV